MTRVIIEIPDDEAAALIAKARAQGLTLEGWLQKIAHREAPKGKRRYSLSELMDLCDTQAPLSDEDQEWMHTPPVGRETF